MDNHVKLCGAKTHRGGICKNPALENGRCRFHGGRSLKGIAAPSFKHGRYSKYLPSRLADRYESARDDSELLVLREEIALMDSRVEDLIKRVDTGEAGALWREAKTVFAQFKLANSKGEGEMAAEALRKLDVLLSKGVADYAVWGEIGVAIEHRRRLVESERKRLVELQSVIPIEKASIMFQVISDAIRRNVTDPRVRQAIAEELRVLWQGQNTGAARDE